MNNKLHLYSIMPLDTEHIDEICEDIRNQYETGVSTCALFSMTLVPEGNPPSDKAGIMCNKYKLFKEKLDAMNVPSGILVQASIGHGWKLGEMFPYQQYVSVKTGEPQNVACPFDDGFRDYIYDVMQKITKAEPDCIMVDDDFRLITRSTLGCACPLHLKKYKELTGKEITREKLWEALAADDEEIKSAFVETQRISLVETAKVMRNAIDSVNPKMPVSFCCVGTNVEFAHEISSILAGEGNPVVIRINNGNYTAPGARYFSIAFSRAASQIAKIGDRADVILAETDTCPQNRYSTGAMSLHTHFTGTILEGASGAKHWITRLGAYEPESGKAYRKILGKHSRFYEELANIVPHLKWHGFRIPMQKNPRFDFNGRFAGAQSDSDNAWCTCVLERFGLPVYFSAEDGGITCLEGDMDTWYTDDEIMRILGGDVFIASDTAQNLVKRGFGKYLGVDVREWNGKQPMGEKLFVNGNRTNVQVNIKELVPAEGTICDSMVYNTVDKVNFEDLFPGTTVYNNELGGRVCTFCGTPRAEYTLTQAFAFLNYSRKQQLIRLANQTEEMPLYYPDDEEVYLRVAEMGDGGLFCAMFNLGLDPIDKVHLVCSRDIKSITKLMPDGTREEIDFTKNDNEYVLETPCYTLNPIILFIK
ncbi:MAG: hypothetical protein IKB50_02700 [Clostridia bacterium]|nr:hypothetical protein [Clostridia bacterium]